MNETILLRFHRNGDVLPVTGFEPGKGLEFAGETSASLVGFRLAFTHDSEATRIAMDIVRRNEDWLNPERFPLQFGFENGMLRISGKGKRAPSESLPAGRYRVDFDLSDTKLRDDGRFVVEVARGERKIIDIHEAGPERKFDFIKDPNFDPATWRVLEHGQSRLDGMPLLGWMDDGLRRVARKACLLNCLAKIRAMGGKDDSVLRDMVSVEYADVDRIWTEVTPGFVDRLRNGMGEFGMDHGPLHPTHFEMRTRRLGAARVQHYKDPVSFRQGTGRRSMQIIVNEPKSADRPTFAEVDIDLGNPKADLLGLFMHIGELLDPGKTDHIGLYDDLVNDGLDDFLYYRFKKA